MMDMSIASEGATAHLSGVSMWACPSSASRWLTGTGCFYVISEAMYTAMEFNDYRIDRLFWALLVLQQIFN